ncbi:MAG: HAD family hydrolase [Planctomycetota bacterium]|nr:MAG: HAD family hydrolase [Planctomycetota bacterium]
MIRAVTFDCFGTLIDWRLGQRRVLEQFPSLRGNEDRIDEIIAARGPIERDLETGVWRRYEEILAESVAEAVRRVCGIELTPTEQRAFAAGQLGWPAFPDAPAALAELAAELPVGLLSNCDDVTLRLCAHKHLRVPIAVFVSAERARSYKPAPRHWRLALDDLGLEPAEVLHVSFAADYDLEPAAAQGFVLGFVGRYGTEPPAGLDFAFTAGDLPELVRQILPKLAPPPGSQS